MADATQKTPRYKGIPKQVSRKDFNCYILPNLKKHVKGPKSKLSFYKRFNYILYVLRTGIQWEQLHTHRVFTIQYILMINFRATFNDS